MKATDLTIGDWLQYKDQFNAFSFKVEQITNRKVGFHAEPKENRMYYLRLCEVQPIPITQEILKRNGFKKLYDPSRYLFAPSSYGLGTEGWGFWPNVSTAVHLFTDDNPEKAWFIRASRTHETGSFDVCCVVWHVHEIQHALRLCGIEKEIVL